MLCFFTRAYNYPDDVFNGLKDVVDFKQLHKKFYKTFQDGFCRTEPKVCTPVSTTPDIHLNDTALCVTDKTGPTKRAPILTHVTVP